jgi:glutamate--cysteine ligase
MSVLAAEANEPIEGKETLLRFHENGMKKRDGLLIGTEHEKFTLDAKTLKPVPYEGERGIQALLWGMQQRFDYAPIMEQGNIIGLSRGLENVSLEPAGQFELSGAPVHDLHQMSVELDRHLDEATKIAHELGLIFLPVGYHPTATVEDMPWMPKGRYKIMRDYMPKKGKRGLEMMLLTCTTQANLDYTSEADMVRKMRVSLALQPVVSALFATSPFKGGKPSGQFTTRCGVWQDVDPDRSGTLPFAFEPGFGFERYVDYALDVPMYFVYRDSHYINCAGQSFRDFMQGKLSVLPGQKPLMFDWINHLTTLYPDVRVKSFIEMRGADVGSPLMIKALPALWVGLLYDDTALNAAEELIKGWKARDIEEARRDAPRLGMRTVLGKQEMRALARTIVMLACDGLKRRNKRSESGSDETRYLASLIELVESDQTQAERLLALYNGEWRESIQPLFKAWAL